MIDVNNVLERIPALNRSAIAQKPARALLSYLLHEKEFKEFGSRYPHLEGLEFIEQVFNFFDFGYKVLDHHKERIPVTGKVVIIANHPLGSLDGLALLKLVREVRPDAKIVANDWLMEVERLHSMFLPVKVMGEKETNHNNISAILDYLADDGAVIIFPAGEVSRIRPYGVRDTKWHSGFVRMAIAAEAPILPIHIDGRNSTLFYSASMVYKPLATMLLVKEMFKHQSSHIDIQIGHLIPYESFSGDQLTLQGKVKLFKRHLYRIPKKKPPLFKTQTPVAHPENRSLLLQELRDCAELLGETQDGKQIYVLENLTSSAVLREIGRLREIAYRAVGEGAGGRRDTDHYDSYYYHLVLWDKVDLEIVGAYRLADARLSHEPEKTGGLYTQTLFDYRPEMREYTEEGLELGRSFVQPKYWGKRSLEYLWIGIGAFIRSRPHYRYLFGPVSMTNAFPQAAKELIVELYKKHYGDDRGVVQAKVPFIPTAQHESLRANLNGETYIEDLTTAKALLANMGISIPTLYKQYSELCEPGGVKFLDFGIDPTFSDSIDGFVLVDIKKMKDRKYNRYIAGNYK